MARRLRGRLPPDLVLPFDIIFSASRQGNYIRVPLGKGGSFGLITLEEFEQAQGHDGSFTLSAEQYAVLLARGKRERRRERFER